LEIKLERRGGEVKHKGWNPEKVRFIIIEFHGHVTSRYRYPISSKDRIQKIIVRVEEV